MNRVAKLAIGGLVVGVALSFVFLLVDWFPVVASEEAERTDLITYALNLVSFGIFGIVMAILGYSLIHFRRRGEDDMRDGDPVHGHTGLELFWTAIPALIVGFFAVWGAIVLNENEDHDGSEPVVVATGQQFSWQFAYPGLGIKSSILYMPVNERWMIEMEARDVIHSFFVAEWRIKQDAVPGITTRTWVTPTRIGTYRVQCTELCGSGHGGMSTTNVAEVVSQTDFDAWVTKAQAEAKTQKDAQAANPGLAVFDRAGCGACHALAAANSQGGVGPSLDNLTAAAADAGKPVDEFVRESITDPNAEIAKGFGPNVMPKTYAEQLDDQQLDDLVKLLASGGSQ
jgi:cytochrome c oxidase subunit 2